VIAHPRISAVRLFGSEARGDSDESSDADLLIVQRDKIPTQEREAIEIGLRTIRPNYSICWYSERALRRMYAEGHLFAWHLYKESANITDVLEDFVDILGQPCRYTEAFDDIRGFRNIISEINASLERSARNATYEAGILFVCTRNIAMIGSTCLADGPYFGRLSPFQLESRTGIQFPLSVSDHQDNMRARTLAHRGLCVTQSADNVMKMAKEVALWGGLVHQYVEEHEKAWA
jgi:hypothetical protein